MKTDQRQFLRFTLSQILEHWVLAVSFTGLAVTGLPQKFVGNDWAEALIGLMGGIEQVRMIHHVSAIIMVLAAIYHVIVVAYKIFVLRVRWTMFPRLDDALDAVDAIRYNIGLTKEHPRFDRFNFAEKAEYWALVWGTIIMGLTGFIMWNPITAARLMPGDLIPASKAAHGAEAILAVLAIFVWHFYNVHLRTFNKTVFTGKLTESQMQQEHGLELQRLMKGQTDPRPSPEVIKRRDRVFVPVAAISVVVMLVAIFLLTSVESTAITPDWTARRSRAQVFAPITPTPIILGTPVPSNVSAAKGLPADHAGRTTCLACHQALPKPAMPADHAGRSDTTCGACHKVGGATSVPASADTQGATPLPASSSSGTPSAIPADHAGRTVCMACHAALPQPVLPADHKGRDDATCTACHKASAAPASDTSGATTAPATTAPATTAATPATKAPATSASGTTVATPAGTTAATPASSSTSTPSGPSAQPADHAGRTVCLGCHATLTNPVLPADHAGRTDDACAACHKPNLSR